MRDTQRLTKGFPVLHRSIEQIQRHQMIFHFHGQGFICSVNAPVDIFYAELVISKIFDLEPALVRRVDHTRAQTTTFSR